MMKSRKQAKLTIEGGTMKKNIGYRIGVLTLLAIIVSIGANAQVDTVRVEVPLGYHSYIERVGKENLGYAAEKFDLAIAEAQVESAKIFPDPELMVGWFDNGERQMKMGYGFNSELSWSLELGGKRKARIDMARSERELTSHLLQDYFRRLRADATLIYLQAILNRHLLDVKLDSHSAMERLAQSDSIRFTLGTITKTDALQSRLEAEMMQIEVYQAEGDWKSSLAVFLELMGRKHADTVYTASGDLSGFDRDFELDDLIITAKNNRADVLAALQNKNLSQHILKLAKANRVVDLGLHLGLERNSYARNEIAETPAFTSVQAGVTIPLKFSNRRKGELNVAQFNIRQSEMRYQQIELEVETEITRAYHDYLSLQKQARQFDDGLLVDSKTVLDGKIYRYERGETSLLDVLDAQRTYNEIQERYYEVLYRYAAALVELESAAGIWDIGF